jgi:hypothetical protein
VCLVFAQDCKFLLSFSLPASRPKLAKKSIRVGSGALACQKKVGNYPNKSQPFGHDQTNGMVHFGHSQKHPKTLQLTCQFNS